MMGGDYAPGSTIRGAIFAREALPDDVEIALIGDQEIFSRYKDEHQLGEIFCGSIKNLKEPTIPETLAMAVDYLHPSFEGEAILSMGKSKDFILKGASGLVNLMPFTCLPGTVVNSLFKKFRDENENIPFLNLTYDGQEQTHTLTRLEAFMYQVRQFQDRRR